MKGSILIQGPAGQLEVIVHRGESIHKTLVICHPHPQHGGTMDNKVVTTIFRQAQRLDFNVVRFNFRGVGRSEGFFDQGQGEQADLLAVMDYLSQQGLEVTHLAGFSFGSYVAYQVAAQHPLAHLITVAPAINLWDFPEHIFNQAWSVVIPGADEVVPADKALQWAQQHPSQPDIYWRAGASHYFHRQLTYLGKLVQLILNQ